MIEAELSRRSSQKKIPLRLRTPLQFLKGVGPKLGEKLASRGLHCIQDLLDGVPRTYEDRRAGVKISELEVGQLVSFRATLVQTKQIPMGRTRRTIYELLVSDSSGRVALKFFRLPFRGYLSRFHEGQSLRIVGKLSEYRGRREFHHPDVHPWSEEDNLETEEVIPIYSETDGLQSRKIAQLIQVAMAALDENPEAFVEDLPETLIRQFGLISRREAYGDLHFPEASNLKNLFAFKSEAHRRLIFDEFFSLELALALSRVGYQKQKGIRITVPGVLLKKLVDELPFQLTGAQNRSIDQMRKDFATGSPMHRLVQGDVGSGKTLVALGAATLAIEAGYQVALMAPTEILAEQHYKKAQELFKNSLPDLKVELLKSALTAQEKREVLLRIENGESQFVVGTHALIEDSVDFKNLALVIVDEQHRFGVQQRNRLLDKGTCPHFLVMTATPIPRTLAMTLYGDLDVTVIDELPPGRTPIITRKVYPSSHHKALGFLVDQVKKGRQAYIVFPLVEESEKLELKNATDEWNRLKIAYPNLSWGLIHGKMKTSEKAQVMEAFRRGDIQVLVATTVIEVGVDVPNANLMMIEHSERFGLSQLHQLRGRVGRGKYQSYCVLSLGHAVSEDAKKRTEIMEKTSDGFKISEADLELRGPGEFLGQRQSGLAGFRFANIARDLVLLQQAREAAFEIVRKDPELQKEENMALKARVEWARAHLVG